MNVTINFTDLPEWPMETHLTVTFNLTQPTRFWDALEKGMDWERIEKESSENVVIYPAGTEVKLYVGYDYGMAKVNNRIYRY